VGVRRAWDAILRSEVGWSLSSVVEVVEGSRSRTFVHTLAVVAVVDTTVAAAVGGVSEQAMVQETETEHSQAHFPEQVEHGERVEERTDCRHWSRLPGPEGCSPTVGPCSGMGYSCQT
jgi:hypothetical protein